MRDNIKNFNKVLIKNLNLAGLENYRKIILDKPSILIEKAIKENIVLNGSKTCLLITKGLSELSDDEIQKIKKQTEAVDTVLFFKGTKPKDELRYYESKLIKKILKQNHKDKKEVNSIYREIKLNKVNFYNYLYERYFGKSKDSFKVAETNLEKLELKKNFNITLNNEFVLKEYKEKILEETGYEINEPTHAFYKFSRRIKKDLNLSL